MKILTSNKIKLIMTTAAFFLCAVCFSQFSDLKRTFTDSGTGRTFNNFKTGDSEAVFFQVLKTVEFLYREPSNNSDPVYSLSPDIFVEVEENSLTGNFFRARVLDKYHGVIEGWVRLGALKKVRYYGSSFTELEEQTLKGSQLDLQTEPHWIRNASEPVFGDSTLSSEPVFTLNKGDLVYMTGISEKEYSAVYYTGREGFLLKGFVSSESLSELALLDGGSADINALFEKYDPVLIRNDIDRSGFISYSGIRISGRNSEEFTEDKVCREISADSILYRSSSSMNPLERKRFVEIRGSRTGHNIAMYRFLPDEKIITSTDTIMCSVIEFVSVPKTAKVEINNILQATVKNSVSKLYITRLETLNMNIVFHREDYEYSRSYSKNTATGKLLSSDTVIQRTVKRLTAFRKH